jgi:hypothetical protein
VTSIAPSINADVHRRIRFLMVGSPGVVDVKVAAEFAEEWL